MAHVNASIGINIKATNATGQLAALQAQLASLNKQMVAGSAAATAAQTRMAASMANAINKSGMWNAAAGTMMTSTGRMMQQFDKGTMSFRQWQETSRRATKAMGDNAVMNQMAAQRVRALQTQYMALGREVDGTQKVMKMQPTGMMRDWGAEAMFAQQKAALFHRRLQMGANSMINWGKNTQWAGRQMMVGMGIPLGIAAVGAVRSFKDIEQASISFKRVYGDATTSAGEKTQMLGKIQTGVAQEMTKYGIAVADTIDVAAKAAATGQKGTDLVTATRETMRLATLGQLDYDQALESTIATQTAFGVSAKEMVRVTDFLNAAENQTILSMDDMTKAIPRVAPVIKGLGGDVEDLGVLMTALRAGGVTAEQGANALKSGLASLINPTSSASEAMKNFGIPLEKIVKTNKGDLIGTVKDFGKALQQLPKFEQQQALEALFGKYQYARMGALFRNINKKQAQETEKLSNETSANLAKMSEDELSQISESAMNKFQGAVERLKAAAAPLGEAILSTLAPVVDVLAKIVGFFADNSAARNILLFGAAFAGLAGVAVMLTGVFANFFGTMMKGFLAARRGMAALRGRPIPRYESLADLEAANAQRQLGAAASAAAKGLYAEAEAANVLANALARLRGATGGATGGVAKYGIRGSVSGAGFMPPIASGASSVRTSRGVVPAGAQTDVSTAAARTGSAEKIGAVARRSPGEIKGGAPKVVASKTQEFAKTLGWYPAVATSVADAIQKEGERLGLAQSKIDSNIRNATQLTAAHLDPESRTTTNGIVHKDWSKRLTPEIQAMNQWSQSVRSMATATSSSAWLKKWTGATGAEGLSALLGGKYSAKDLSGIAAGQTPRSAREAQMLLDIATKTQEKMAAATTKAERGAYSSAAGGGAAIAALMASAGPEYFDQRPEYQLTEEEKARANEQAAKSQEAMNRTEKGAHDDSVRATSANTQATKDAAKQTESATRTRSDADKQYANAQNRRVALEENRAKYEKSAFLDDKSRAEVMSKGTGSRFKSSGDRAKDLAKLDAAIARAKEKELQAYRATDAGRQEAAVMAARTAKEAKLSSNLREQERRAAVSAKGFSGRQFAAGIMGGPNQPGGFRAGGAFTGDKANAWSNKLFGLGMAADMVTMGLVAAGKEVPAWTHMVGMGMMTLGMFPGLIGKPASKLGAGMKAATTGLVSSVTPALKSVGHKAKVLATGAGMVASEFMGFGKRGQIGGGITRMLGSAGIVGATIAAVGVTAYALNQSQQALLDKTKDLTRTYSISDSVVSAYADEVGKESVTQKANREAMEELTGQNITQAEAAKENARLQTQSGQAILQTVQAAKDMGTTYTAMQSIVGQVGGLFGEGLIGRGGAIKFATTLGQAVGLDKNQMVDLIGNIKEVTGKGIDSPLEVDAKLANMQLSPESLSQTVGAGMADRNWWDSAFADVTSFKSIMSGGWESVAAMMMGGILPGVLMTGMSGDDVLNAKGYGASAAQIGLQNQAVGIKELYDSLSKLQLDPNQFEEAGAELSRQIDTMFMASGAALLAGPATKDMETVSAMGGQETRGTMQLKLQTAKGALSPEALNKLFKKDETIDRRVALAFEGMSGKDANIMSKIMSEDSESGRSMIRALRGAETEAERQQIKQAGRAYADMPSTKSVRVNFRTDGAEEIRAAKDTANSINKLPQSIQKKISIDVDEAGTDKAKKAFDELKKYSEQDLSKALKIGGKGLSDGIIDSAEEAKRVLKNLKDIGAEIKGGGVKSSGKSGAEGNKDADDYNRGRDKAKDPKPGGGVKNSGKSGGEGNKEASDYDRGRNKAKKDTRGGGVKGNPGKARSEGSKVGDAYAKAMLSKVNRINSTGATPKLGLGAASSAGSKAVTKKTQTVKLNFQAGKMPKVKAQNVKLNYRAGKMPKVKPQSVKLNYRPGKMPKVKAQTVKLNYRAGKIPKPGPQTQKINRTIGSDESKQQVDPIEQTVNRILGSWDNPPVESTEQTVNRVLGSTNLPAIPDAIQYVKRVPRNFLGGEVVTGFFASGGTVETRRFKRRQGKITGPGGPTADKIPSMLSNGEFVVRASSVNKYGTGFLHKVNRGQIDPSSVRYLNKGGKADGKNTPGKKTKGASSDGDKKDKNTGWKDLKKELKNLRLTFESTNKLIGSKKFTKGRIPINLLDQALQTDDPKAMKELLNKKMSKVRADARKALRQEEAKNFFAEYNESMKTLKAQKARVKALRKGSIRNREFESKLSDAELIYFDELNGKARKKWRKTKERQFEFEKRNLFYEEKVENDLAKKRNANRQNFALHTNTSKYRSKEWPDESVLASEYTLSMSDASIDEYNRLQEKINSTKKKSKKKKLLQQQEQIVRDGIAAAKKQEQIDKKLETIQNYRSRKESLGQEKKFSKFVAGGRQATDNLIGLNQTALTSLSQEDFELLNALDDPAAVILFTAALNEAAEAARQAAVAERQLGLTKETQFSNRFSSAITAGLTKDALAGLSAEDFEMMLTMTASELAAFKNQLNAAAEAAKRSGIQAMSQGERMQEMSSLLDNLSQSYKDQAIAVAEQNILNQSGLTKAQIEANIQRDQLKVSKKQQEATIQQREIDDINKQYDEQAKILDKIGQTQQIISNLQKGRLSVASALSSGDIAAAAAAAQEQRSAEAQANIDMMRQALQDEKEQKIEQRQDIIDGLQDDIDILNDSIFEATTLIEQNMVDAAISGAAMSREIDIQNTRLKDSSTYWSAIRADINESIGRMLDVAGSDFSGILSQTGQLNEAWQTYANTLGSIPGLLENAGGTVETQGAPAGGGGGGADTTGTGSSSNSGGGQSAAGDKTKWEKFVAKINKLKQQSDKEFILKKAVGKGTPMGKWQQKFKALKESNKDLLLSAMDGANVKPGERQKINNTAGFYAKGGWIPGVGNRDSVHAMVMPGEFIVNKRSAQMFGPMLEKINNPNYKFAGSPGMTSGGSMVNSNNVYNITVNAGAGSSADEIATITLNKIKELDRMNIREMRKF